MFKNIKKLKIIDSIFENNIQDKIDFHKLESLSIMHSAQLNYFTCGLKSLKHISIS